MRTKWTKEKTELLLDEVILSATNHCINIAELSTLINVSESAICHRLVKLRQQNLLPQVDRNGCANPDLVPYSDSEKKFIVGAHKAGLTFTEIAELTERSVGGIHYIIGKLISSGDITPRQRQWSQAENTTLLELVKFDSHGCVVNYPELAARLGVPTNCIANRIARLRKNGSLPHTTGVSIKALKAYRAGNKRIFTKIA